MNRYAQKWLPQYIFKWHSKFNKFATQFFLVSLLGFILVIVTGCQGNSDRLYNLSLTTPTATSTVTPSPQHTDSPDEQGAGEQIISTPTLAPTVTPGKIDNVLENLSQNTGLDEYNFFGLSGRDLASLLMSALIVFLGSIVGWLLVNLVIRFVKFSPPGFDDQLLAITQQQIRWLFPILLLQFATARLDFLAPEFKQWLNLIYSSIIVIIIATIILRLVEFGLEGPLTKAATPEQRNLLITFFPLIYRMAQVAIIFTSLAIILKNFGFNLSALLAILGLGGLAVSLAAKETLADMISGFIILIEQPYQIGDRIKIETMDTWGDVESIGMRTTRIRTLDNRLVIVPNSVISRNQVENYTYPDPSYRVDISVGIGYDSDLEQVEKTIEDAVARVPGLLDGKDPFAALDEFGDSALIYRVQYWLRSYNDVRLQTEVHKAIYRALTDANIEMPFITYDVNLAYQEADTQP
jgi:small-conductance mechanosensitive channel